MPSILWRCCVNQISPLPLAGEGGAQRRERGKKSVAHRVKSDWERVSKMVLKSLFKSGYKGYLIALLAGIMLAFCFAPHALFPLPILSLALLLGCWLHVNRWVAFWRGFLFGLGLFGVGASWVYVSIHDYGQTSLWIAGLITLGFVMLLSLIPAITGYVLTRFFTVNNATKMMAAFPSLWFFFEWIKSWLFTGFPWLDVGYTQLQSPLRDYAPYIGSYGLSFLVALCAGMLVFAILSTGKTRYKTIAGFLVIWALAPILGLFHFTSPVGNPVRVTLIQANIPPLLKWDPEQVNATLSHYQTVTQQHWDSQMIVWPESAIPLLHYQAQAYLEALSREALLHKTSLVIGIPTLQNNDKLYNSLMVFGDGHGIYNKRHLVPFGEFTPQQNMLKAVMEFLEIPMANFASGSYSQLPPVASGVKLLTLICYESAFADLVRTFINKAELIVTLSDDLWFGHSWAIAQHLQMTQMRALEIGRYALFANNNGSSAIINAQGRIEAIAPDDAEAVISSNVQPMQGYTPWTWLGLNLTLFVMLCLLIMAGSREYDARHK